MEGTGSFEEAREVALAAIDALSREDLEGARELFAEDVEYVNREGPQRGFEAIAGFWLPQLERFRVDYAVDEVVDAGNGAVIVLATVTRLDRQTDEVEMRAWPATVFRIRDGKIVFLEGYQDRRKAFSDLGIEPG